jgi:uncharacterized cupin superfamily protein
MLGYGGVLPSQLGAADEGIGVVTELEGEAWIVGESGELISISEGMAIPPGVEIKCAGKLTIRFKQGSSVVLEPETTVVVEPGGKTEEVSVVFSDGSHLSLKPETTVAVQSSGKIEVKEGSAEFTSSGGETVMVERGDNVQLEASVVEPGTGAEAQAEAEETETEAEAEARSEPEPEPEAETEPEVIEPASPAA